MEAWGLGLLGFGKPGSVRERGSWLWCGCPLVALRSGPTLCAFGGVSGSLRDALLSSAPRWSNPADGIQINNNSSLLRMNKIVFVENQLFTLNRIFF